MQNTEIQGFANFWKNNLKLYNFFINYLVTIMKKNPTKNNTKYWSSRIDFKEFLYKSNVVYCLYNMVKMSLYQGIADFDRGYSKWVLSFWLLFLFAQNFDFAQCSVFLFLHFSISTSTSLLLLIDMYNKKEILIKFNTS